MHDLRAVRADPAGFDAALARRGLPPTSAEILRIDAGRREALAELQEHQHRRNQIAREIGQSKRAGGAGKGSAGPGQWNAGGEGDGSASVVLEAEAARLRDQALATETRATSLDVQVRKLLEVLPNVLDPEVPDGADERANVVLKQSGEPRDPGFPAREHFELGEALGQMLFEPAARMSGSRFTILQGGLARLERALGQFMLDLHVTKHGYMETQVPLLVNDAAAYGTDKLPKFAEDMFHTTDGRWLISTSEVPLTSLVMDQMVPEASLPIRVTALSECFRSEAGAAGRDTRGMLRQHQFRKVEMVSITHPDESADEHERMTMCAEAVLEELGLVWRRVLLCAGDTGFGAAKTYDLEVWLPGQKAWREISSCSNTRAFQARRMNARVRGPDGKAAGHVHTLNGSGVAVGRALIAVMETHQRGNGAIEVPQVLAPYMGGVERIG